MEEKEEEVAATPESPMYDSGVSGPPVGVQTKVNAFLGSFAHEVSSLQARSLRPARSLCPQDSVQDSGHCDRSFWSSPQRPDRRLTPESMASHAGVSGLSGVPACQELVPQPMYPPFRPELLFYARKTPSLVAGLYIEPHPLICPLDIDDIAKRNPRIGSYS